MTVQTVPFALQNASHSAALFRQAASAPFASAGVLGSAELLVTQLGSPGMGVLLKPGRAKIAGTAVAAPAGQSWTTQAMYDVLNDGDVTLTIATADATNPRIDLVYIQVQDSAYSGSANQAIAGVVTGTPAPSPSAPATPSNAIALYRVAVAANATSIVNANLTRVVPMATLLGRANPSSSTLLSQYGTAGSSGIPALTSGSTVQTVTFSNQGGPVLITISGRIYATSPLNGGIQIFLDGSRVAGETPYDTTSTTVYTFSRTVTAAASAGSHTVTTVISNLSSNTGTAYGLICEVFAL